jgi:hypothetical protein
MKQRYSERFAASSFRGCPGWRYAVMCAFSLGQRARSIFGVKPLIIQIIIGAVCRFMSTAPVDSVVFSAPCPALREKEKIFGSFRHASQHCVTAFCLSAFTSPALPLRHRVHHQDGATNVQARIGHLRGHRPPACAAEYGRSILIRLRKLWNAGASPEIGACSVLCRSGDRNGGHGDPMKAGSSHKSIIDA